MKVLWNENIAKMVKSVDQRSLTFFFWFLVFQNHICVLSETVRAGGRGGELDLRVIT